MAHSIDCPACAITIRLSDDTVAKRIVGHRVKIVCRGCQGPFFVDGTGPNLRVSLIPPPGTRRSSAPPAEKEPSLAPRIPRAPGLPLRTSPKPELGLQAPAPVAPVALAPAPPPRAHTAAGGRPAPKLPPRPPRPEQLVLGASHPPSRVPEPAAVSLVPESRAPIIEEELPTRPLNERPFIHAEAPAPFYEPPPTSRSLDRPQLSTHPTPEVMAALSKPRKPKRYATAAALAVMFAAGMVAARPTVSDWVTGLLSRSEVTKVAENTAPAKPVVVVPVDQKVEENSVRATKPEVPATEIAATPGQSTPALQGSPNVPAVSPSSVTLRTQPSQKSSVTSGASVAERSVPATPAKQTGTPGSLAKLDTSAPAPQAVPPSSTGGAFDKSAAVTALQVAAAQASGCRKSGDPSGMARVVVTFAPSGRVTSATISGPPFSGTQTGGCIASQFRSARVPAFEGALVTVTRSVVIQ